MVQFIKHSAPYVIFRRHAKAAKRYARLPRYLGRTLTCPVCGIGLRAFKPIWKSYVRDAERFGYIHRNAEFETFNTASFTCPRCDATDRERLMALYLDAVWPTLPKDRPIRFIDFAPAHPLSVKIRRYPAIAYRSADLYSKVVQDRIDLTDIGYADASVDIFICSHILEHIPDDRKAMRELVRILAPTGFGLMLVPLVVGVEETFEAFGETTADYRWKHFGMADHVRQYGRRDFIERLTATGFGVEPLGKEHFGADTFRRHGIADNSVLYVVRPRDATRAPRE